MTTEEFWGKYCNSSRLEIFEIACDFFSKRLPQDFIDNYEVGEILLEVRGHQENEKNFDNVLRFTEIIRSKQPQLYEQYFQYFDDFLVDYFCFYQDWPNVDQSFSGFLENPLHDFDRYSLMFKKILFYQHSELLEQAITSNFATINGSEDLIGGAEYELAVCRFYMSLQKEFTGNKGKIDKSKITLELSAYNFDLQDDFMSSLEVGLNQSQIDASKLKSLFGNDKELSLTILQGYFLRYMYQRGFEFYLSGRIWDKMTEYWCDHDDSSDLYQTFFRIRSASFEKYVSRFSSFMFFDTRPELISILWGSVYVYEFLTKYEIVPEQSLERFIELSRQLKGTVIGKYTADLWNANFVHQWSKPDCISETEFLEEQKIFEKSISFKNKGFKRLRSEISNELKRIGPLSNAIIEGGKKESRGHGTMPLDDLFSAEQSTFQDGDTSLIDDSPLEYQKENNVHEKVGRNEPCPCGSGKKYKKCCGF